MNGLDVVLVLVMISAAIGGYHIGFVARLSSWVGTALGMAAAAWALPGLLEGIDGASPLTLLAVAMGTVSAAALVGQAAGLLIGGRLHVAIPAGRARRVDQGAGSALGLLGVLALVWLLLPIMADVQGTMAEQTRDSALARFVDRRFPDPPDTLAALRRLVGGDQFPQVFEALRRTPELGPPPAASGLSAEVQARAAASTVKVSGTACRRTQEGSGVVVGPDLVVTNAHVVAGERSTIVQRLDGSEVGATIVAFDPARDVAVLLAPGLDLVPLELLDGSIGQIGAVFGHPGGGPLRPAPFEIGDEVRATGRDIYDRARTEREVLVLAASLAPGDSGGALVDPGGRVLGLAFAIAPDRPGVAYALETAEVRAVLAGPLAGAVDTGGCLT